MRQIVNQSMYETCLLLSRADRAVRLVVARELERYGLTMMEWLMLATVCYGSPKGISMTNIAKTLDVTLPQVTALSASLIKLKLVKQKVSQKDRRSRQLTITRVGKQIIHDIDDALNDTMKIWLGDIPEPQLQSYVKTINQIATEKVEQL
jgi:DNA-binding MarR family transcriptional regulator